MSCEIFHGEKILEFYIWFPLVFALQPFPFADYASYSFADHRHEGNSILEPSCEPLNLRVVSGTLDPASVPGNKDGALEELTVGRRDAEIKG